MHNLIIYGAGDLARLACYYATEDLGMNVLGFVVDDEYFNQNQILNLPVLKWSNRPSSDDVRMFVSVGYKSMRARSLAYHRAEHAGYELVNLISPHSFMANNVVMGVNNFVLPGAVIEPYVLLGNNNTIWSNASICHDSALGDHNFVASNVTIGGNVNIGNQCFFGFNSTVTQGLKVENEVLLAAGSTAICPLVALNLYAGCPATIKKSIDSAVGISIP